MNYTKIKRFFCLFLVVVLLLIIIATLVVAFLGDRVDKSILYGLISTMIFLPIFMYLLSICFKFFDQRNKKIIDEINSYNEKLDKNETTNK